MGVAGEGRRGQCTARGLAGRETRLRGLSQSARGTEGCHRNNGGVGTFGASAGSGPAVAACAAVVGGVCGHCVRARCTRCCSALATRQRCGVHQACGTRPGMTSAANDKISILGV